MPGRWLDIPVQIDAGLVSEQTQVRIVPDVPGSHYMPYMHWAYQGNLADSGAPDAPVAAFGDAVELATLDMTHTAERLTVDINMRSQVAERGDYRVFLHVYDDIGAPPVAQADRYPLDGATPPGNWLPGEVQDGFMVDLKNLSVGAHTVALGFYDPATGERLQPTSDRYRVLDDGRLLLGEINIDG